MTRWSGLVADAPEFAARVRARFAAGTHKTLATVRADGSPRISGIEIVVGDDDLTLGMMGGSVKLADVRRDPRVALHSPTVLPRAGSEEPWTGDAKVAGVLVPVPAPADDGHEGAGFFALDVAEVVLVELGDPADHLVLETWHAGRGYRRRLRKD